MTYTKKDFERDLNSPEVRHTDSLGHFADFYNELGKMPVQKEQKYLGWRMDWIKPRGKMLELGCHAGFNLIHYARLGYSIVGVDVSDSLIKQAQARIRKQPREVRTRIALHKDWIEKFTTEDRFDTILLTETLEHVINPVKVLAKAAELLADGGKIYVTAPDTLWGNNAHLRGISRESMLRYASKANLRVQHWEPIQGITACILVK